MLVIIKEIDIYCKHFDLLRVI